MKQDSIQSILLIGPFPDPISGVSLANKVVKEQLNASEKYKVSVINTSYKHFDENLGAFSFSKMIFYLGLNFKVFKVIKNKKIYITPGQTFFGIVKYAPFILLSSWLKKELIIHVHGNYLLKEYELLSGSKKRIFKSLLTKFNKGIVLSDSLKDNLLPFINPKKIYSLPNFAQNYLWHPKVEEKTTSELRIVFLSNLMKEKGILLLLKALIEMQEKGIYFKVKIAGNVDANTEKETKPLIKEIKNIEYLGVVKGQDKRDLLTWSNVFVLPTFYKMEGQPISILEAMATKNVVITTNHAGIKDIFTDQKNGFFVSKKKTEDIVDKLTYLSKNLEEIHRISNYNESFFLQNFTEDKFSSNLLKILNN